MNTTWPLEPSADGGGGGGGGGQAQCNRGVGRDSGSTNNMALNHLIPLNEFNMGFVYWSN